MFAATDDDRGTVQALARDLDQAHEDGMYQWLSGANHETDLDITDGVIFSLSPRHSKGVFQRDDYETVLQHLSLVVPHVHLRSCLQPNIDGIPLGLNMLSFDYVIINALRYYASSRALKPVSSLVEIIVDNAGNTHAGELLDIIHINQAPHGLFTLGRVRWLRPLEMDLTDTIWQP